MSKSLFPPPGEKAELEEGQQITPRFDEKGLITAIVTDFESGELLMVAHMNDLALSRTIETGESHFWSRSRNELWHKGATSGTVQTVKEMRMDCDQDAIWLKVSVGGASATCHTGMKSCFYRKVEIENGQEILVKDSEAPLFDPDEIYGNKS